MTLLAVPIAAGTIAEAERMIRQAEADGAELIELRLDLLAEGSAESLPSKSAVPMLATCRDKSEGGGAELDDGIRAGRVAYAVAAGARFVDFELSAWDRTPEAREVIRRAAPLAASPGPPAARVAPALILSAHSFSGPPAHPEALLDALQRSAAQIVKLAYHAERITDCFLALDVLHASAGGKPAVALAMGEAGVMTRLVAKKLGAFCTFAALDEGRGALLFARQKVDGGANAQRHRRGQVVPMPVDPQLLLGSA